MIWDRARLAAGDLPPVAIVGSGPAGVSLALRLAENGVGSVVIEAGSDGVTSESQAFYEGEVVGDPYYPLDVPRVRAFGGTSNHWTGWVRTLDPEDFARREDIPHTGWPIGHAELAPYRAGADEILEVGPFADRPISDTLVCATRYATPRVNFAEKYRAFFETSGIAHLCLDTAVHALRAEDGRITALDLRDPTGAAFEIAPRIAVVCCGGIENSRLLLWSNAVSPQKVVAEDAALGRYWMEHPEFIIGEARLRRDLVTGLADGERPFIAMTTAASHRHGVLNGGMRFSRPPRGWEGLRPKPIAREIACMAPDVFRHLYEATDRTLECDLRVIAEWEQAPVPENRVALSDSDRDAHGVPRPVLHWRKTALDYRTPKVLIEMLGRHLVETGTGEVRVNDFVIDEGGYPDSGWPTAYHHMGGTRMAATPSAGVVDANLRIFGMANAYVLGSSVFPTGGHANPTLTIVMLALRLGDHLAREA